MSSVVVATGSGAAHERARVAVLRRFGVLDTEPEQAFDDLTSLAAQLCGAPMALVSLVETDRQWFKSRIGVELCETSRDVSFCAHALSAPQVLVVPDARLDPRFADNPLVTGAPGIVFYAGAPLTTSGGFTLGTLCVLDVVPRVLTPVQLGQLEALARQVVCQLELRGQAAALAGEIAAREGVAAALRDSQGLLVAVLDHTDALIGIKDLDGRFLLANPALHQLLPAGDVGGGAKGPSLLGHTDHDLFPALAADELRRHDVRVATTGVREVFAEQLPHPDGTVHGYLSTKFALRDEAGQVYAVAGVSTDVTELSQERAAHAEAEQRWRALVEHSPVAVAVIGDDGCFAYANPKALEVYGVAKAAALIGRGAGDFVPPDDRQDTGAMFGALLRGGRPVLARRWVLRRRDGTDLTVEINAARVTHLGRRAVQVELRDVTGQAASEAALRASEARFKALFAHSPVGAGESLPDGTFVAVNPQLCTMLGYTEDEMLGQPASMLLADGLEADRLRADLAALGQTSRYFTERRYRRKDGSTLPVLVGVGVVRDDEGQLARVLATVVDITELASARDALQASEQRFRTTFTHNPAGLAVLLPEGRPVQTNAALGRMLGVSGAELLLMADLTAVVAHERDREALVAILAQALAEPGRTLTAEYLLVRADGSTMWALVTVTGLPVSREQGRLLLQVEDVTARKAAESRLTRQALHDNLTDLPNRAMLLDRMTQGLARLARQNVDGGLAVLFCDLDGFKAVNDEHGHEAGDHLLVQVARRLSEAMRPTDTVARLGGDEFVVLCEDLPSPAEAARIAERLEQAIRLPVSWHDEQLAVTASIGIAHGAVALTAEDLLRRADTAMYAAKRFGKDCHQVYDEDLRSRAD